MATKLTLTAAGESEGRGEVIWLQDPFDSVIDRVFPAQQASSALEARTNMVHTKTDGKRILIHPSLVGWVEEDMEEDG